MTDQPTSSRPLTPFSLFLSQSRFIVLLAVISVLLVAVARFLLGVIQAVTGIWGAVTTVASR